MRGLVRAPGIDPHVDIGSGPCVLLLSGLGAMPFSWEPVAASLSGHRILAPVTRGTLEGDEPRRLRIAGLAEDAVRLLDHAGVSAAHVIGNSLGGMIAQEMALRHPTRVRSLSLLATSTGTVSIPLSPWTMLTLARAMRGGTERRERLLRACLRAASMAKLPPLGGVCLSVASPIGARAQFHAAARWTSTWRLGRIAAPTLVVHGREDRLVPAANARLMARRIPTATLELLRGAGHLILDDAPERVGAALTRFLAAVEAGRVTEAHTLLADRSHRDAVSALA
jgi:pimeloyl-ACP methyl ester carboxylesterase